MRELAKEADVFAAANRLVAEGQNVTIERVRLLTNGGSNTTLTKHLQAWRATDEGRAAPSATALPKKFLSAAEQSWQILIQKNAEDLQLARAAFDEEFAARQQAEAEVQRLTAALELAFKDNEEVQQSLRRADAEVASLLTQQAATTTARDELRARAAEQAAAIQAMQEAERRRDEQNAELLRAHQIQASENAQLQQRVDDLQAQLEEARRRAIESTAVANGKEVALSSQLAAVQKELAAERQQHERAIALSDRRHEELQTQLDEAARRLDQERAAALEFARTTGQELAKHLAGVPQVMPAAKSSRSSRPRPGRH